MRYFGHGRPVASIMCRLLTGYAVIRSVPREENDPDLFETARVIRGHLGFRNRTKDNIETTLLTYG
jgi:hypothetical protein